MSLRLPNGHESPASSTQDPSPQRRGEGAGEGDCRGNGTSLDAFALVAGGFFGLAERLDEAGDGRRESFLLAGDDPHRADQAGHIQGDGGEAADPDLLADGGSRRVLTPAPMAIACLIVSMLSNSITTLTLTFRCFRLQSIAFFGVARIPVDEEMTLFTKPLLDTSIFPANIRLLRHLYLAISNDTMEMTP